MKKVFIIIILTIILAPSVVFGASQQPFYYEAWIPFWKQQAGAQEISLYLDKFHEISPFSYEVRANGTLKDSLKINEGFWPGWLKAVHDLNVKIIPTVALLDRSAIHKLLSNKTLRNKHIINIVSMVKIQKFDGVDIDYENKAAADEPYFSAFIKSLSQKLHGIGKNLTCTIEGRTPATSQFVEIPKDIAYANNYSVINSYCDEVRIMVYDQGNIDLKLNAQKGNGQFYMPVADPDWVEKVIQETLKTIDSKKVVLGIPTYGYVYEVSQNNSQNNKTITYKRLRSVTFKQAVDLAQSVGATIFKDNAGEPSFSYATSTSVQISKNLTYKMEADLLLNLPVATDSSKPVSRFVSFSNQASMQDKVNLAKKYNLRGAVFFKMDGETDPALWNAIAMIKK